MGKGASVQAVRKTGGYRASEIGASEMTEQQNELQPGTPIYWLRQPRGGWGYVENVIGITIKPGRKRIGIAVLKADRKTWVPKWISPDNIQIREV